MNQFKLRSINIKKNKLKIFKNAKHVRSWHYLILFNIQDEVVIVFNTSHT